MSLDGDADRAIFVDETGDILDGDQVMAMCAKDMHEKGTLKGQTVVATVMSNLGFELALKIVGMSTSCAPKSATATSSSGCWRAVTISAASSRDTSYFWTTTPPATAPSPACKCLALMVEKGKRLSELNKS